MKYLVVYCDGGSRGNPGLAASAFVIFEGKTQLAGIGKFLGTTTNNQAEYQAVVFALKYILDNKLSPSKINFYLDSELIVRQMKGIYRIKDQGLQRHAIQIRSLEKEINVPVSYEHIPRSKNKIADSIVNQALDLRSDVEDQ